MRSRSIVLIMISLGFGAIAAVGMLQVLSQRTSESTEEEKSPVLVALSDLDIKDELTPENVEIQYYPVSLVPDGVVTQWDDAQGKRIMARVHRGMPIMAGMLFDKHQISDVVVPAGYKVIAISVNKQDSFHGLLKAGDRVDIIGIRKERGDETARTFMKNVQVYAVDNKTDRIPDREEGARSISTVQLVVNQQQSERIIQYERQGDIRLVMGSQSESSEPMLVDFDEVQDKPRKTDTDEPSRMAQLAEGVGSLWSQLRKQQETATAPVKTVRKREHVMQVISTSGQVVSYEWQDKKGLPSVAGDSGSGAPTNQPVGFSPNTSQGGQQSGTSFDFDDEDADY